MGDLFEQYGDTILSVIAAGAFLLFLLQLVLGDGTLYHVISEYESTICLNLPFFWKGGL